jgi:hypothetical protein
MLRPTSTISVGLNPMFIPDGDIDVLARDMMKHFPTDAADQATLRSNAFFVLGHAEKSKKWLLVTHEIKKIIQAGQKVAAGQDGEPPSVAPPPRIPDEMGMSERDANKKHSMSESRIPILIAMVAWSELLWALVLRA